MSRPPGRKEPRKLALVKRKPLDVGRPIRQWWKKHAPADILAEGGGVVQIARDVSVMAMAHLARRLTGKRTPVEVKDTIGLALAMRPPKLTYPLERPPGKPGAGGDGQDALLNAYDVSPAK